MTTDHDHFARLVGLVHDDLSGMDHRTSALQLYRDARDVAEQRIPGPLGVAVAAVLAREAYERAQARMGGCLGADKTAMALAVAVLSIVSGPVAERDAPPATIRTVDDLDGLPAGSVLRMVPTRTGRGPLVERDEDGWVHNDGSEPLNTALVGATVLHVPRRDASGITTPVSYSDVEQATKALVRETWLWLADERVNEQVGVGRERLVRRFAERLGLHVSDRPGLDETEGGDHG